MHPLVPLAIRILVPPVVQALLVSRLVLEPAQQVVQALEQHQVLVLVLELELELELVLVLELYYIIYRIFANILLATTSAAATSAAARESSPSTTRR